MPYGFKTPTKGPLAWISEYNASILRIARHCCGLWLCTPLETSYQPAGTPVLIDNAANAIAGNIPAVVSKITGLSLQPLGILQDVAKKETGITGALDEKIEDFPRVKYSGFLRFTHSETPGTVAYQDTQAGGITSTPTANTIKIGVFLPSNRVLYLPDR